jgi:hypothetical protein
MLPGQIDIFDWARERRDQGMSRAVVAQGPRWADVAYAAIERVAIRQPHVHIDDVLREGVPRPDHYNAWGAVWMRAIRDEIIQRTTETRLCTVDPGKNAHRYPIYFSRIHDPRCA